MDEKESANVQNMVAIDYGNGIVIPSETMGKNCRILSMNQSAEEIEHGWFEWYNSFIN